jgi:phospholipid transport system substrate-binding protein
MRRSFPLWALALATALLTAAPSTIAAPNALAFISDLGHRAIQVLGPNIPAEQRLSRFRELLRDDFDVPGIGRFVLGRYWRTTSPQERREFLGLCQEYVAQACSARLREYGGEPPPAPGRMEKSS